MAYIRVDYKMMINTVNQIENYISTFDNNMELISNDIVSINSEWEGKDYQQFKAEWDKIKSPGSTSYLMRAAIQNYADEIKEAVNKYKEAQIRAINKANSLCK